MAPSRKSADEPEPMHRSDVSVIGTGAMGSAVARAWLRTGRGVTVWNRTREKAARLEGEGATMAADVEGAVTASPVIAICVDDYATARQLLEPPPVTTKLDGRTLLQLGGGTPAEAREAESWARARGAAYVDVEIMAYPEAVVRGDATLLAAADESAYAPCEPLLQSIAGSLTYLGPQVGAVGALGWAMMSVAYGALLGALHGARICEVEGLGLDLLEERLGLDMATIGEAVRDLLARIRAGRYDDTQASLRTNAIGAEQLLQHARDTGITTDFPAYVATILRRGMDAGLGEQDLAAMIGILRRGCGFG